MNMDNRYHKIFIGIMLFLFINMLYGADGSDKQCHYVEYVWLVSNNTIPLDAIFDNTVQKYKQIKSINYIPETNIVKILMDESQIEETNRIHLELLYEYYKYCVTTIDKNKHCNFDFQYSLNNTSVTTIRDENGIYECKLIININAFNDNTIKTIPYILQSSLRIADNINELGYDYNSCAELKTIVDKISNQCRIILSNGNIIIKINNRNLQMLHMHEKYFIHFMQDIYESQKTIDKTYVMIVDRPICL